MPCGGTGRPVEKNRKTLTSQRSWARIKNSGYVAQIAWKSPSASLGGHETSVEVELDCCTDICLLFTGVSTAIPTMIHQPKSGKPRYRTKSHRKP